METRKRALACFIGGFLCYLVACWLAPHFWWLGILAGMAGGYLSYDFREVILAVPVAWQSAKEKGSYNWEKGLAWLKEWLAQPHPFVYPAVVLAWPMTHWVLSRVVWSSSPQAQYAPWESLALLVLWPLPAATFYILMWIVTVCVLWLLAQIGAEKVRCFWGPDYVDDSGSWKARARRKRDNGYTEMPLTYRNAWYWVGRGFLVAVIYLGWTWWTGLVWEMVKFLGHLIRLVHSHERVLCAIFGALGGLVAYLWLSPFATSLTEHLFFAVCGGLLGGALGKLDYEVFSKRLLHVGNV